MRLAKENSDLLCLLLLISYNMCGTGSCNWFSEASNVVVHDFEV